MHKFRQKLLQTVSWGCMQYANEVHEMCKSDPFEQKRSGQDDKIRHRAGSAVSNSKLAATKNQNNFIT